MVNGSGGLDASCPEATSPYSAAGIPVGGPSSLSPAPEQVQQQIIIPEYGIERRLERGTSSVRADAGGHRAFRLLDGHDTDSITVMGVGAGS